ncbi:hypothetical protein V5O48_012203 [Marasmius crinis-equi]|uniref:Uncharacterized protein n=1 Tax=Marasmius crinis-equi TaxID=585013 RepID=A0ABR3F3G5_9AGAR
MPPAPVYSIVAVDQRKLQQQLGVMQIGLSGERTRWHQQMPHDLSRKAPKAPRIIRMQASQAQGKELEAAIVKSPETLDSPTFKKALALKSEELKKQQHELQLRAAERHEIVEEFHVVNNDIGEHVDGINRFLKDTIGELDAMQKALASPTPSPVKGEQGASVNVKLKFNIKDEADAKVKVNKVEDDIAVNGFPIPGTPSQCSTAGSLKLSQEDWESFSPLPTPAQRTQSRHTAVGNIFQGGSQESMGSTQQANAAVISYPPTPVANVHLDRATPGASFTPTPTNGTRTPTPGCSIVGPGGNPIQGTIHGNQKFVAYVVYVGNGGAHGVFKYWHKNKKYPTVPAGSPFVEGYADALWKGIRNEERAREYYEECRDWQVFDRIQEFLRGKYAGKVMYFIVTKGLQPGVYNNVKDLVETGLGYRGGQVYTFQGSRPEASTQFTAFYGKGEVEQWDGIQDGDV